MDDGAQHRRIVLAGASGTIGAAVLAALEADGHAVTCLTREHFADSARLAAAVSAARPGTVVSCIASRSGAPKDAWAVDYRANAALLGAAEAAGAGHFVLLSAICVQKPRLAFQHAKLAFEAELRASAVDHTIVRPTAFFKSLSGQALRVAEGGAFMVFGDGELTSCKPISDRDCARFVADCVTDPSRRNRILPIGGPGPAITMRDQGALLFAAAGREPRYRSVPVGMFPAAAHLLSLGAWFSGWLAEKAEYARIAHYYATESMLVWDADRGAYDADATPEFGEDRLIDHYRALLEGISYSPADG